MKFRPLDTHIPLSALNYEHLAITYHLYSCLICYQVRFSNVYVDKRHQQQPIESDYNKKHLYRP